MALLELDSVTKRFGGLLAVSNVSFSLDRGEILSMIGPNGAGKTTAFNCVTGLFPITSGQIRLDGVSISGLPPHRITKLGIARTFQNIRLFAFMTAVDNVMVGAHWWMKERVWDGAFQTKRARSEERSVQQRALSLLDQLGLSRYAGSYARDAIRLAAQARDRQGPGDATSTASSRRARGRPQQPGEGGIDAAHRTTAR